MNAILVCIYRLFCELCPAIAKRTGQVTKLRMRGQKRNQTKHFFIRSLANCTDRYLDIVKSKNMSPIRKLITRRNNTTSWFIQHCSAELRIMHLLIWKSLISDDFNKCVTHMPLATYWRCCVIEIKLLIFRNKTSFPAHLHLFSSNITFLCSFINTHTQQYFIRWYWQQSF